MTSIEASGVRQKRRRNYFHIYGALPGLNVKYCRLRRALILIVGPCYPGNKLCAGFDLPIESHRELILLTSNEKGAPKIIHHPSFAAKNSLLSQFNSHICGI